MASQKSVQFILSIVSEHCEFSYGKTVYYNLLGDSKTEVFVVSFIYSTHHKKLLLEGKTKEITCLGFN